MPEPASPAPCPDAVQETPAGPSGLSAVPGRAANATRNPGYASRSPTRGVPCPADEGLARRRLIALHLDLERCRRCPGMQGPPVHGESVLSPVMLIGQAPGTKEIEQLRPFCWTAGKTLFRWLESIGLDEEAVRSRVLISAVCRCFPGKNPKAGDRVPDRLEVENCRGWWGGELELLRPRLLIPVGKLAIDQFRGHLPETARLDALVGRQWSYRSGSGSGSGSGIVADLIPLPHPSGASTWFKMEPGRTLLPQALRLIAAHPAWRELLASGPAACHSS